MLGVMSVAQGVAAAEEAGLDLVEVSPNAEPPVCKVLDFGKYKYEMQKKAAEARKKQKTVDVKEIKVRPNIEDHDYGVKIKAARKFLNNEDKVKVTLRFRGREMAHKDLAAKLLDRIREDLADLSKVDLYPKMEGRQMIMVLSYDKTAAERVAKQKAEAEKAALEAVKEEANAAAQEALEEAKSS
jgi:translation initiation factor IF-3